MTRHWCKIKETDGMTPFEVNESSVMYTWLLITIILLIMYFKNCYNIVWTKKIPERKYLVKSLVTHVALLQFESGFRVAHSCILLHFDKNNFTVEKLSGEPTTSRYRMQSLDARRQLLICRRYTNTRLLLDWF